MRAYNNQNQKRTTKQIVDEDSASKLELPPLKHQATDIWDTSATVQALGDRDPTQFSKPSVVLFHKTIQDVDTHLQKAHLDKLEHH